MKVINFERGQDLKEAMDIGINRRLQIGVKLKCIQSLSELSSGKYALTKGKKYSIVFLKSFLIQVEDDFGDELYFSEERNPYYFCMEDYFKRC